MNIPSTAPQTSELDIKAAELGAARTAIKAYKQQYAGVLAVLEDLEAKAAAAEAALKAAIRPTGVKRYDAHGLAVTVRYGKSESYDAMKLLARRPELWVAHPDAFVVGTDKKEIQRLADLQVLTAEDLDAARVVKEQTPAVTIKDAE